MTLVIAFLLLIAAYLIGSIPFGYLISKVLNIDIRKFGSGNIGATNVYRTLGPVPGAIVFVLDLLKGTLPVYLAIQLVSNPWLIILVGIAAVIGHTYPIYLKFKGGRGAATGLGILLGIAPDIFVGAVAIAALIIYISRYVSLASIITPIIVTIMLFAFGRPLSYGLAAGLISIIIIARHIPNIKRLRNGTERKIGDKSL